MAIPDNHGLSTYRPAKKIGRLYPFTVGFLQLVWVAVLYKIPAHWQAEDQAP